MYAFIRLKKSKTVRWQTLWALEKQARGPSLVAPRLRELVLALPQAWDPSLASELRLMRSGSEGLPQDSGEEKGRFSNLTAGR